MTATLDDGSDGEKILIVNGLFFISTIDQLRNLGMNTRLQLHGKYYMLVGVLIQILITKLTLLAPVVHVLQFERLKGSEAQRLKGSALYF